MHSTTIRKIALCTVFAVVASITSSAQGYTSFLTGSNVDADVQPEFGIVLMGGAGEDDNAMTWFLERVNGGDVVVIRTSGSDGYNDYLFSDLGVAVNSVETIVFNNASAATDPYVVERLQNAEGIWMAGGNQATYVNFWLGTPVEDAINDLLNVRGGVVGGISAGMAVLGGSYFSALNGTVTTEQALANPFAANVTVGHNSFLNAPFLENVTTDTHYDDPDRRGRHTVFLARRITDTGQPGYGIACDEYGAVCIGADGIAHCYGEAPEFDDYVYFIRPACEVPSAPNTCVPDQPLDWNHGGQALKALRINASADGGQFLDLNDWLTHSGGDWFDWTVSNGVFNEAPGMAPECAVSVGDVVTQPTVKVYPNPATDYLVIDAPVGSPYAVFGMDGRKVTDGFVQVQNEMVQIVGWSAGLYSVVVGNLAVNVKVN